MKAYTLGELSWVRQIGCFRNDAISDMIAIGIDKSHAIGIVMHTSFLKGDLIGLYHDYGDMYGPQLEKYFDFILQDYPPGWPHN